jgi:hypothetical protein
VLKPFTVDVYQVSVHIPNDIAVFVIDVPVLEFLNLVGFNGISSVQLSVFDTVSGNLIDLLTSTSVQLVLSSLHIT